MSGERLSERPLRTESDGSGARKGTQTRPDEGIVSAADADRADDAGVVLDDEWVVKLLRIGYAVAIIGHGLDVILSRSFHLPSAVGLPVDWANIIGWSVGLAYTYRPSFARRWEVVTWALCMAMVASWTFVETRLGAQAALFSSMVLLMLATSVLVLWRPKWQAILTGYCLAAAAINTAVVPVRDPYIGVLWLNLVSASALTVVGSRLWTRWRVALARTWDRLRDSEAQLRKVIDANADSVALLRFSDRRYIYVNDEFLKRGYAREQVLGKSVAELGMTDRAALDRLTSELELHGSVRNQEVNVHMADGRICPHLVSSVLVDVRGERCVLSVARDISGLKKIQNELIEAHRRVEQSETKLRKIFEASPETICITSARDGRFIDANPRFFATGYTLEEVKQGPPDPALTWADKRQYTRFVFQLLKDGLVENLEADFRAKNGSVRPCLISGVTVELDGEPCAVTFSSDISRLKRAEAELVSAREVALSASRAKSDFLSSMSHEIRTPMNAILGMADLLIESSLTNEQRRFVETMVKNGNALLDLINGILDLAKVESGRLDLEETDFNLAELVELVTETLAVRAHEKGLELLFRIPQDLPAALVGDPLRLRQILINLVSNAIKFTEQGEVVLTVERERDADGLVTLRFSVRDTGPGIARDQIDNIFQTFTQADSSTSRRFGGSGLGLAIARQLTELMGGRIWVESQVGRGSTFHFTASFRVGTSERSVVEPLDLGGMRILVVDDNPTSRLILRELLIRLGAEVQEAVGGKEALTAIERSRKLSKPYRLILLDCRMPEMDGFEVAEQLKKREPIEPQPTILMLTSDDMSQKLARIHQIGIRAYVVKPVKRSDLFRAIAMVLSGAEKADTEASAAPDPLRVEKTRSLKILLADDSPDNRLLIEAYLKDFPYLIDVAENGAVAVEKFSRNAYDVVLMDVQMPVMDGLAATRRIRQWENEQGRKPTPIVALTASALEENVRQSMDAGCTAHVSKPVKKTSLLAVIHDLTDASTGTSRGNGRAHAEQPL